MNQGRTLSIALETAEGYFVAPLDNGGARVGLKDCHCFDFPAEHEDFDRVTKATAETVEALYDEFTGAHLAEWGTV